MQSIKKRKQFAPYYLPECKRVYIYKSSSRVILLDELKQIEHCFTSWRFEAIICSDNFLRQISLLVVLRMINYT